MGLYDTYVLPHVLHCSCGVPAIRRQRQQVVPRAKGRVLEIGVGTGLNLPFYNGNQVERLFGLEPAVAMHHRARLAADKAGIAMELLPDFAEAIPLESGSIDTVVSTYTLCTISDVAAALAEIGRVLRPKGCLLFCEHGRSPDPRVQRCQDTLNPLWNWFGGGCHLNRDIPSLLRASGWVPAELNAHYIPGPRLVSFNYWGVASLK